MANKEQSPHPDPNSERYSHEPLHFPTHGLYSSEEFNHEIQRVQADIFGIAPVIMMYMRYSREEVENYVRHTLLDPSEVAGMNMIGLSEVIFDQPKRVYPLEFIDDGQYLREQGLWMAHEYSAISDEYLIRAEERDGQATLILIPKRFYQLHYDGQSPQPFVLGFIYEVPISKWMLNNSSNTSSKPERTPQLTEGTPAPESPADMEAIPIEDFHELEELVWIIRNDIEKIGLGFVDYLKISDEQIASFLKQRLDDVSSMYSSDLAEQLFRHTTTESYLQPFEDSHAFLQEHGLVIPQHEGISEYYLLGIKKLDELITEVKLVPRLLFTMQTMGQQLPPTLHHLHGVDPTHPFALTFSFHVPTPEWLKNDF